MKLPEFLKTGGEEDSGESQRNLSAEGARLDF